LRINVRQETPKDIEAINDVTVAAFLNAPHTDHTEQFIVRALREADALAISLVAERSGQIVGHVALSPVSISDGSHDWYGLGPISVLPSEQGRGTGSLLMREAIVELNRANASGCVLLGDPNYYHRFGFRPISGLEYPGVPVEYFQALLLNGAYPQGTVTYHASFSAQR
jgi:putative acetyltransferase